MFYPTTRYSCTRHGINLLGNRVAKFFRRKGDISCPTQSQPAWQGVIFRITRKKTRTDLGIVDNSSRINPEQQTARIYIVYDNSGGPSMVPVE